MDREKKRVRLWIPSIVVSALVMVMIVVVSQQLLTDGGNENLSAEMKDTLSVFHDLGEPAYYFTVLPFEPEKVYATEVKLSTTRSVELKYLGREADNEYIGLNIYFDMPDGFDFGHTDYQKSFENSNGERIDYFVEQSRPDLQVISWTQDDFTFQVMNMHNPMTDPEIKELINSMKKYE